MNIINSKTAHALEERFKPQNPRYAEVYIRMASERSLFLNEDVGKEMAANLSAMLLYLNAHSKDEIDLFIHTNGGDVSALMQIYDVMNMVSAPINTINLGKAYSAGAVLLSSGTKGRRYGFKNSRVMVHGIQASFPNFGHNQDTTRLTFDVLKKINKSVIQILAKNTGKSLEQIDFDSKRDFFMNANQAKEYGIIDHII